MFCEDRPAALRGDYVSEMCSVRERLFVNGRFGDFHPTSRHTNFIVSLASIQAITNKATWVVH